MSHRKKIYKNSRKDLVEAMKKEGFALFLSADSAESSLDFGDIAVAKKIAKALGAFHCCAKKCAKESVVLPIRNPHRYLERTEERLKHCSNKDLEKLAEYSFILLCDGTLKELLETFHSQGEVRYGKISKGGLAAVGDDIKFRTDEGISEDLALLDLSHLLQLYLRDTKESEDGVFEMIKSYEEEKPLTSLEKRALFGFLLLPYELLKNKKEKISKGRMKWYRNLFLREGEVSSEVRD